MYVYVHIYIVWSIIKAAKRHMDYIYHHNAYQIYIWIFFFLFVYLCVRYFCIYVCHYVVINDNWQGEITWRELDLGYVLEGYYLCVCECMRLYRVEKYIELCKYYGMKKRWCGLNMRGKKKCFSFFFFIGISSRYRNDYLCM